MARGILEVLGGGGYAGCGLRGEVPIIREVEVIFVDDEGFQVGIGRDTGVGC